MKRSILIGTFIAAAAMSLLANADCMDVVHKHTMAPVSEMKSLGVDDQGYTTVIRTKDNKAMFGTILDDGKPTSTVFQCDGKGKYRQYLTTNIPAVWSVWRDGTEWNAAHWMTF